jgi:SAM-dependent methyltransferase
MSNRWRQFWSGYRAEPAASESDLFVQVGKTINRQPVSEAVFADMVSRVAGFLRLERGDHLCDLCCGNGLVTHALASRVARVTAIDFADHLIEEAKRWKSAENIRYWVGDVEEAIRDLVSMPPDKVLMNDSLGYFVPSTFGAVLDAVVAVTAGGPVRMLVTGVPAYELRWNFYDTPERRDRFLAEEARNDDTHQGMGRWWTEDELREAGSRRGFVVDIKVQPVELSSYRIDVLYTRD